MSPPWRGWNLFNLVLPQPAEIAKLLPSVMQAGRYVRKGERAAYILTTCLVPVEDGRTGQVVPVLKGFWSIAVSADNRTEGEDLASRHFAVC